MENEKLYVVVRSDLEPGARAAQLCHAAIAFVFRHGARAAEWFWDSNNIVLLECRDEAELLDLTARARSAGIDYALFQEPDFGMSHTAAAFGAGARRMLSRLPLALKVPKKSEAERAA